jgi:sodium pump decarboxylase gamma subunit
MENLISQGGTLMVIGMATVFAFLVLLIGAMKASAAYFRKFADRYEEPEAPVKVSRGGGDVEVAVALAAIRAKRG